MIFKFYLVRPFYTGGYTARHVGIYFFEGGQFKNIYLTPDHAHGYIDIDEIAISGDGKRAISFVFNNSEHFWLVDIDSELVARKPLRLPLRNAIERRLRP